MSSLTSRDFGDSLYTKWGNMKSRRSFTAADIYEIMFIIRKGTDLSKHYIICFISFFLPHVIFQPLTVVTEMFHIK